MRPALLAVVVDSSPKTELFLSRFDMITANLMFKTPVLAALHFRVGVVLPRWC